MVEEDAKRSGPSPRTRPRHAYRHHVRPTHDRHAHPPTLNRVLFTCQGALTVSRNARHLERSSGTAADSATALLAALRVRDRERRQLSLITCEGGMQSFEASASSQAEHGAAGHSLLAVSVYDCFGAMTQVAVFEGGKLNGQHLLCSNGTFRATGRTLLPPKARTIDAERAIGGAREWLRARSHTPVAQRHPDRLLWFKWLLACFHMYPREDPEGVNNGDDRVLLLMEAARTALAIGSTNLPSCASVSSEVDGIDATHVWQAEGGKWQREVRNNHDTVCNGRPGWLPWVFCRGTVKMTMQKAWIRSSRRIATVEAVHDHVICKGTSYVDPHVQTCQGALIARQAVVTAKAAGTCDQHVELQLADGTYTHTTAFTPLDLRHTWDGFVSTIHGRSSLYSLASCSISSSANESDGFHAAIRTGVALG